jgi:ABC-2 type transport system permease protein
MSARRNTLYWSVRREIWENRSIYLAPLIVTVFVLLGGMVGASRLPKILRAPVADPASC